MALVPFVGRLKPGATEEWNAFADEMFIHRREAYLSSRRRLGVIKERVLLQRGPDGDAVIYALTVHGVAPEPVDRLFRLLAESQDEFDVWYKRRMRELHRLDFDAGAPLTDRYVRLGPPYYRPVVSLQPVESR